MNDSIPMTNGRDRVGHPIKKLIGFAAGVAVPFAAVIAFGILFDSRGGEPFSGTVMLLIVWSPLWGALGIGLGIATLFNSRSRIAVVATAIVLIVLIVISGVIVRHRNASGTANSPPQTTN